MVNEMKIRFGISKHLYQIVVYDRVDKILHLQ